ncbi:hypothetical protein P5V15_002794 [Pogonomyrmex californicus]
MLVLNEAKHAQRDNASFTKKTPIDNTRSSGCIKKRKKLNASNIKFLQTLGFTQQDLYTLPYESFLYVEGKLTKNKVVEGSDVVLGNNFVAFIFDEIRYELDGVEIDRNRNVSITSALKYYVMTSERSVILRNG